MQLWRLAAIACLTGSVMSSPMRSASAETLVGISQFGNFKVLLSVDTSDAYFPDSAQLVRGLPSGSTVVALDQRPATGELIAVVKSGASVQLYSIDEAGAATAIGEAYTDLQTGANVSYGFDFNPTIDRARLVSTLGENLVFNPDDGTVTVATDLAYAVDDVAEGLTPAIAGIAYDNNVADATETQQRGIDVKLGTLVTVANNAGTLGTIGRLRWLPVEVHGFDISGETGTGYAVLSLKYLPVPGILFEIDLETGVATPTGVPGVGVLPFTSAAIVSDVSVN